MLLMLNVLKTFTYCVASTVAVMKTFGAPCTVEEEGKQLEELPALHPNENSWAVSALPVPPSINVRTWNHWVGSVWLEPALSSRTIYPADTVCGSEKTLEI